MPQNYTPEFKKKIVRLHEEEGRTYKSITAEYGVSKASISKWCSEFSKECQSKALENPDAPNEMELMKEDLRLRKQLEEAKKGGKQSYQKRLYSRPKKLESFSTDDIYVFDCTQLQAYNYFFSFGSEVEIISPDELRNKFQEELKKALKQYQ